jgi:hypothetical protein
MQVKMFKQDTSDKILDSYFGKRNLLPHVNVGSVDAYFALPKNERERFGLYLRPLALPTDGFWSSDPDVRGWAFWKKEIKKQYPIQAYIREFLLSYDNPVYAFFSRKKIQLSSFRWKIDRLIKPLHPRIHKAYRRYEAKDVSEALIDVNFALILDFWHEEVTNGIVSWTHDKDHRDFHNQLKKTVKYIEVERPALQDRADKELTRATNSRKNNKKGSKASFSDIYGKHDALEKKIEECDTATVLWAINNRGFFWT